MDTGNAVVVASGTGSTALTVGLLTMRPEDVRAFAGMLPSEVRTVLRETVGVKGNALTRAVGTICSECRAEGNAYTRLVLDQYCEKGGVLARPVISKTGNILVRGQGPVKVRQTKTEADLIARLQDLTGKLVRLE